MILEGLHLGFPDLHFPFILESQVMVPFLDMRLPMDYLFSVAIVAGSLGVLVETASEGPRVFFLVLSVVLVVHLLLVHSNSKYNNRRSMRTVRDSRVEL